MRKHALATIPATLLAVAPMGAAADLVDQPVQSPPAANAPFEQRDEWCQTYASWFVGRIPDNEPMPADVRPTHRLEVEVQFCRADPIEYKRLTSAELSGSTSAS